MAAYTFMALAAVGAVHAAVTPTAPGPGDSFNQGANCAISYTPDATATWTNVTVSLMTGSNLAMVHLEDVQTGMDGTKGSSISWPCPAVTPNSAIYFYQFTNNGIDPTWTTRFTIATTDGKSTPPPESKQPNGDAIPWGTGKLIDGSASGNASASGSVSGNSTVAPTGSSVSGSSSSAMRTSTSSFSSASSSSRSSSSSSSGAQPTGGATNGTTTGNSSSGASATVQVWFAGAVSVAGAGLAALLL